MLSSCAVQKYEARPLEPQALAEAFEARRLDQPGLMEYMIGQGYPADAFPLRQWGLRELTLAAFYFHPSLEVARASWKSMQVKERIAAEKPVPGVSTQIDRNDRIDGKSPWSYGVIFSIPIEQPDKRAARIDQAASLSEAARIEIAQSAWQVRSNLRGQLQAYAAVLHRITLLQEEIGVREEIVQMLQNRVDAGMVSNLDLNQARLQLQKSHQLLAALQNSLPEQRATLAAAVGVSAEAMQDIIIDPVQPVAATPSDRDLQRAALLNRLDIRAALARYDAAESNLRMEIARQYPDIVLSPGYVFDQGYNLWTLGFSFLLNMLNKNEKSIADARASRELEASQFLALQAKVLQDLAQAQARYLGMLQNLEKQEKLLQAQKQRTLLSQRQFEAGYIDRLELTATRLEETAAKQSVLESSIQAEAATLALEDALQKPLDSLALPDLPEPETAANEP
ncbi:MAG: TolC family protein [Methylobacterium sp.]|nr:TolC family protein [Methylobacterium sp.]